MNIEQIADEAGFTIVPTGIFAEGVSHVVAVEQELYRFAEIVRRQTLLEIEASRRGRDLELTAH
jgi:hypothetical protein